MLDPKFIKENLAAVVDAAQKKRFPFDAEKFTALYEARLRVTQEAEALRRLRNEGSDAVKKVSDPQLRQKEVARLKEVSQKLSEVEASLRGAEDALEALLLTVPSIPSDDTPVGASDADNVEWRKEGVPPQFSFEPQDHMHISQRLGLVDFQRGVHLAGSRSYVLVGWGARLERAVHNLALDILQKKGFSQLSVPVLVKSEAMTATGYLPGGADQAYFVEKDDLWLVGTAEVSLAGFHANEILDYNKLPVRICAHSSCFRREAGAHGKDTKGFYRVHQFQKIEQVIFCAPSLEQSNKMHFELLQNAEDLLHALELPYRVVRVCTGDLGQGQVKKHDIETWMPSRKAYGETHSCSSFLDFQSRRLKTRTKDPEGKTQFVYTLNNTMAATPRLLIPLLENHQTADGRVRIPIALRPYLGGAEFIAPA